jgi:hypothetical protein
VLALLTGKIATPAMPAADAPLMQRNAKSHDQKRGFVQLYKGQPRAIYGDIATGSLP